VGGAGGGQSKFRKERRKRERTKDILVRCRRVMRGVNVAEWVECEMGGGRAERRSPRRRGGFSLAPLRRLNEEEEAKERKRGKNWERRQRAAQTSEVAVEAVRVSKEVNAGGNSGGSEKTASRAKVDDGNERAREQRPRALDVGRQR
jgi:hypothetical protein